MTKNIKDLSSIQEKLIKISAEIKGCQDYLESTSGPAEATIAELNLLKQVQAFYRKQYKEALKNDDSN